MNDFTAALIAGSVAGILTAIIQGLHRIWRVLVRIAEALEKDSDA